MIMIIVMVCWISGFCCWVMLRCFCVWLRLVGMLRWFVGYMGSILLW